jgi:hypothetical protein
LGNGLDGRAPPGPQPIHARIKEVYRHPSFDLDPGALASVSSGNSYDIAVFTLDRNSTDPVIPPEILAIPALPANPDIEPRHIQSPPERFRWIAYGCNTETPGLDGFKQTALVTLDGGIPISARQHRYLSNFVLPQGCPGDSGSPIMERASGNARIVAVVAAGDGTVTHYTRANNVRRWVEAPHKLNLFANTEMGFFLNHGTLNCLDKQGAPTLISQPCDGRTQPTDTQYWRVVANGQFFQIQNTSDSTCLSAGGAGSAATCDPQAAGQRWSFIASGSGYRLTNSLGTCLEDSAAGLVSFRPCSATAATQRWSFFP